MHALELGIFMTNSTTNNDNHSEEASGSAVALTSAASLTINDEVGLSVTVGGRAYGYVSSKSYNGYITQTVNIKATYTVSAAEELEYSIQFDPNFHGMFRISESGSNVTGNHVTLSALTANLNGNVIPSLGMSGGSQNGVTSQTLDRSTSYTLMNQWGDNVYELIYTFTITTDSQDDVFLAGTSTDSFLWGMDNSSFHTYSTDGAKDADGLFLPATLTILTVPVNVPEPSTYAGFTTLALLGGTLVIRKRRAKAVA